MSAKIFREWIEYLKYDISLSRESIISPVTSVTLLANKEEARVSAPLSGSSEVTGETEPAVTAVTSLFEERAAIMEYDGGLPRAEAEQLAWLDVRGREA